MMKRAIRGNGVKDEGKDEGARERRTDIHIYSRKGRSHRGKHHNESNIGRRR